MSDYEREFAMCDYCEDKRGMCDMPHLVEGRRFSIKLEETFEVETVHNDDKCFLLFFARLQLFQRVVFIFSNSTSLSNAMQDAMSWRGWVLKIMRGMKQRKLTQGSIMVWILR